MNNLNKYKLIHEKQSGFRQTHSCQTAQCIANGDFGGFLFVDFKKSFRRR